MKAMLFAAIAAVGLSLGLSSTADAAWTYQTVTQYDPACGRYVQVTQRVWVPDPVVVVTPPVVTAPPVVVAAPPIVVTSGYRYAPHYRYDHHYHHHGW
jgi:hypothetical protein